MEKQGRDTESDEEALEEGEGGTEVWLYSGVGEDENIEILKRRRWAWVWWE